MMQKHGHNPSIDPVQTASTPQESANNGEVTEQRTKRLPWSPPRLIRLAVAGGTEKDPSAEEFILSGPS